MLEVVGGKVSLSGSKILGQSMLIGLRQKWKENFTDVPLEKKEFILELTLVTQILCHLD